MVPGKKRGHEEGETQEEQKKSKDLRNWAYRMYLKNELGHPVAVLKEP